MQQTLELSIRANIEEILGKEKLKSELEDISHIAPVPRQQAGFGTGLRNDPVYQELAQALSTQQLQNAQKSVETPFNLLG